MTKMKKRVFISYSYQDKEFVEWLQDKLKDFDIEFWYDQAEIGVGESIKEKVNEGLNSSSAFILVLSHSSKNSEWVKYEMNSALLLNAIKKGISILPIKIDDSEVPADLSGYLYADFSKDKDKGLELLRKSLLKTKIRLSPSYKPCKVLNPIILPDESYKPIKNCVLSPINPIND